MDKKYDIVINEKGEKVLVASSLDEGTIKVPEGVVHIGDKVFEWCVKITKVILPSSVKAIGSGAFTGCSMEEVILPEGLEVIGDSAFFGCRELKRIAIPKSIKQIGNYAFYDCKNLEKVILPEGLETLGRNAFARGLKIELLEHMKRKQASRKSKTKRIELAKDKTFFAFTENDTKVTGVQDRKAKYDILCIPDGVTTIVAGAFYSVNVKTVILPESVETIEANAFKDCKNFKRIYLPSRVKIIGKDAFAGCKQLEIYCEDEPQEGWINLPDEKKTYYEDMTEAFNFHRSSGSFDERHIVERTEIIRNTYNPEKRPVHTHITRDEFVTKFVK